MGSMLTEGGEDSPSSVHFREGTLSRPLGTRLQEQEGRALTTGRAFFLNLQEASRRSWMALLVSPEALPPEPKAWVWLSPAPGLHRGANRSLGCHPTQHGRLATPSWPVPDAPDVWSLLKQGVDQMSF